MSSSSSERNSVLDSGFLCVVPVLLGFGVELLRLLLPLTCMVPSSSVGDCVLRVCRGDLFGEGASSDGLLPAERLGILDVV